MDFESYSLEQLAASLDGPASNTLDKLQLTLENAVFDQNERFKQRANSKLLSLQLSRALCKLGPVELTKQYERGTHCAEYVLRENDRLTSKYCSNRFCLTCNRIRTANLINGYGPVLDQLPDLQFVTLTIPNVPGTELKKTIQKMTATFAKIKDLLRKRGIKLKGIRKTECTYNDKRRDFHPHFHLAISGKEASEMVVLEWLAYFPKANHQGQDIKKADSNTKKELFKYFTKITTNNKNSKAVHITALNRIFSTIKGLRIFQPFGIKKIKPTASLDEIRALMNDRFTLLDRQTLPEPILPNAVFVWSHGSKNWVDRSGTRLIPDFAPWKKNLYFYKNFVYEADFWPDGHSPDDLGNKDANPGFIAVCTEMVPIHGTPDDLEAIKKRDHIQIRSAGH